MLYFKHSTRFRHSCDHTQTHYKGWIYQDNTQACEPTHRFKILNFNNTVFYICALVQTYTTSLYPSFVMHAPEDGHKNG
jgi:hypothetical protein